MNSTDNGPSDDVRVFMGALLYFVGAIFSVVLTPAIAVIVIIAALFVSVVALIVAVFVALYWLCCLPARMGRAHAAVLHP